MTAPSTFTVGLVQMAVTGDRATTVAAAIEKIREAAGRGAQIISLQELFNAPYFCKSLKLERFDIAEPIPGPTVETLQRVAQELGVALVVPIYEKQAPGLYKNSAAVVDADGTPARRIPQDAHPARPHVRGEVLLHAGGRRS